MALFKLRFMVTCLLTLCMFFICAGNARKRCNDVLPHYCRQLKRYLGPMVCRTTDKKLREVVTTKCINTCGFCRQAFPLHCSYSRYGCCWDNLTPMEDPWGKTCPQCKDTFPHTCFQFRRLCSKRNSFSGGFIRMACPVSCARCTP